MTLIINSAQAGTLESNDIMLIIAPGIQGNGIVIDLQSIVFAQYGPKIKKIIKEIVVEQGIIDIYIKAVDRGALDCTIKARTRAAVLRATGGAKGVVK